MNKAAEKVSQAQGKEIYFCLRDASKGRESDVLDCLLRDPRGKVQRMMDKTTRDEAKSCGVAPDFGFAGADAVNEIAREQQVELLLDLLGEDLGSVVHQGEVGNCQAMTVKAYGKVFSTSLKIFNTCKKLALRSGTAVSASDLAGLCFAEVSGDARGKIERMVSKLDGVLGKKCPGLSVSGVFPGVCAAARPIVCTGRSIAVSVAPSMVRMRSLKTATRLTTGWSMRVVRPVVMTRSIVVKFAMAATSEEKTAKRRASMPARSLAQATALIGIPSRVRFVGTA